MTGMLLSVIVSLLLLAVVASDTSGVTTVSPSSNGISCGVDRLTRCLAESNCSWGSCLCSLGKAGNGDFACYERDSYRAEVSDVDNTLRSYNNSVTDVIWPCNFRFTEFIVSSANSRNKYHFQVNGLNRVLNGRIALTGVKIRVEFSNYTTQRGIGIRVVGLEENGTFRYTQWGQDRFFLESAITGQDRDDLFEGSGSGDNFLQDDEEEDEETDQQVWSSPVKLETDDGEVEVFMDQDNFVTVSTPGAGTQVRFRAPNKDLSQQDKVPGLSVRVDADLALVTFPLSFTYLADSPTSDSLPNNAQRHNLPLSLELLHRLMEYAAQEDSSEQGLECRDTSLTYRLYCDTTSKKVAALKSCSVFLNNSKLVFCMDSQTGTKASRSLNAFKLCVWQTCQPRSSICRLLRSRVQGGPTSCLKYTPPVFSDMKCDELPPITLNQ